MVYYGDPLAVKERLQKPLNETNWDSRISRCLVQVSALIDQELVLWGETVPLSPVPQVITDIANDWATGIMLEEDIQPTSQNPQVVQVDAASVYPGGQMNVFVIRAKANLRRYMRKYSSSIFRRT